MYIFPTIQAIPTSKSCSGVKTVPEIHTVPDSSIPLRCCPQISGWYELMQYLKYHWEIHSAFRVYGHKLSGRVTLIDSLVLDCEGIGIVWASGLSETLQDTCDLTIIPAHNFSMTLNLMHLVTKVSGRPNFMFSWCENLGHLVNLSVSPADCQTVAQKWPSISRAPSTHEILLQSVTECKALISFNNLLYPTSVSFSSAKIFMNFKCAMVLAFEQP